jgi:hypothetical protein
VGLVAAVVLARAAQSLFFGVGPADPLAFAAASTVLLIAAVAGCLAPARRAGQVDPGHILRE